MEKCNIFDCEWHCYHPGVIIDKKVYVLDKENKSAETSTLIWGPWKKRELPLMSFYIGENEFGAEENQLKWGTVNILTGEIVVPPIYDYVFCFCDVHLAQVILQDKTGFIDNTGKIIGGVMWDKTHRFVDSAEICAVRKGALWGYIGRNGDLVFEPQFQEVGEWEQIFSQNLECGSLLRGEKEWQTLAWVKKDGKYGWIDDQGNYFLKPQFDGVGAWEMILPTAPSSNSSIMLSRLCGQKEYVVWVKKNKKFGYLDGQGNYLVDLLYDSVRDFWAEYYAPVKINGKWGFIDRAGRFAVQPVFSDIGQCCSDFYMVKQAETWGILTHDLEIIMPEEGTKYVVYKDEKITLKKKKITSRKKLSKGNKLIAISSDK